MFLQDVGRLRLSIRKISFFTGDCVALGEVLRKVGVSPPSEVVKTWLAHPMADLSRCWP